MPQDKSIRDTAESVFARIQRRRHADRSQHAPAAQPTIHPEDTTDPDEDASLRDLREAIERLKAEQVATGQGATRQSSGPQTATESGTKAHAFRQDTSRPGSTTGPGFSGTASAKGPNTAGATKFNHSALHDAEFIDVDEDGNPLPPPGFGVPPGNADAQTNPDGFPRSKTLRFLLKHPGIGLLVAVPTATVMLRSASTRRALYRLGRIYGEREVWRAVDRLLDGGTNRR
ncbi:MAG: hypothetical protein Q4D19_07435 [Lautropia sp.]|nr:hypothetical protein [Lautropia sp.]